MDLMAQVNRVAFKERWYWAHDWHNRTKLLVCRNIYDHHAESMEHRGPKNRQTSPRKTMMEQRTMETMLTKGQETPANFYASAFIYDSSRCRPIHDNQQKHHLQYAKQSNFLYQVWTMILNKRLMDATHFKYETFLVKCHGQCSIYVT